MCGIVGFCDFTKRSSPEDLSEMMKKVEHRGSDASGQVYQEYSSAVVGLGHQRLSILDLSNEGIQPMAYEHLEIVYNGEVYNFKEIRVELEALDYNFHSQKKFSKMLAIDYQTYMVDNILTKVDRASMSVGLEGREPFLDKNIIEFAAQLPAHFKYRDGEQKWVLKQIAHRYLPKELMNRPKMGFSPPITEWFRDELKSYFIHYLSHEKLNQEGYFNTDEVIKMRDEYLNGKNVSIKKLWSILMFQMWHEKWM